MIHVGKTARRYARALYQLSTESSRTKVENTYQDVLRVKDDLMEAAVELKDALQGRDLLGVLSTQEFGNATKHALFERVVNQHKYQKAVLNFYGVLIDMGKFSLIDEILAALEDEINQAQGRTKAIVQSAMPLTEEQAKHLRKKIEKLTGKETILETEVNPGLVGGVRIEVDGKVYDFSLHAQLQRLSRQLVS